VTYPPSRVPLLPVLSFGGASETAPRLPSVLDLGKPVLLTSGRAALAAALVESGVAAGHSVLLPAYNCASMVEPVRWRGAKVVLFRVRADLSADLEDVLAKIDATTRAIVVVHYFGFPQDLRELRRLCDSRGILLIEDCAHAFFGSFDGGPPGRSGDYAIASIMKFYPTNDGGCLVSARREIRRAPHAGGWKFQLKAAFNLLENATRFRRLRPLSGVLAALFTLKDRVWARAKRGLPSQQESIGPAASEGGYGFDGKWLDIGMSWISRRAMAVTSVTALIARRRRNYRALAAAFANVPGCRALYGDLPEGVVPYMFPLLVDAPAEVFPALKNAGVPLFRWEDIDAAACAVSARYASELLQVPCHQELREDELRWMVDTIAAAVSAASAPRRAAARPA
jgi:dTDP-4-amino-4,6-dideoxygalactose transaminase